MISAAGRSYKILSGLVDTTHVPQDLTCIHCLSSFIYADVLCLVPSHSFLLLSTSSGSAHLHPTSLHSTPFPHTRASQHITQRYSPPIDTCPRPSVSQGKFPFSDPQCTVISVLTEPELSPPPIPGHTRIAGVFFAAIPSRARCRPMFE